MDRSEWIGKRIRVIDPQSPEYYAAGSTGVIVDYWNYKPEAAWVKFDEGQDGVNYDGNPGYLDEDHQSCYGIWIIQLLPDIHYNVEAEFIDEVGSGGYIVTGQRKKGEWKPDQVREDVDLMQSIRDACGG